VSVSFVLCTNRGGAQYNHDVQWLIYAVGGASWRCNGLRGHGGWRQPGSSAGECAVIYARSLDKYDSMLCDALYTIIERTLPRCGGRRHGMNG
jgi:hypothetical protein